MNEPSIRHVAVLPVIAVVAGGVFVLSTVVGQSAPEVQDCGPGSHSMAMGTTNDGGMDHSAHMAMGGSGGGCMGDDAMQEDGNSDGASRIDPPTMPSSDGPTKDRPEAARENVSPKKEKHSAR